MTRNDLDVRRNLRNNFAGVLNVTIDVAAAVQIYERQHAVKEVIAHVNDVRAGKEDNGVAVGVPAGKVDYPDLFTIKVN